METRHKYVFIDGDSLLVAYHYSSDVQNIEGRSMGGADGILRVVSSCIKRFRPEVVTICWNDGVSELRDKLYPNYKTKKRKVSDQMDIQDQIERVQRLYSETVVRQVCIKNIEAKDSIAYLAGALKGNSLIVSNNNIYYQVLSEKIDLYNPIKEKLIKQDDLRELLGFDPKYFLLWKSIVGDSQLSIKGIDGVGKIRARILIRKKGKGKKIPIKPEEQNILDRNKYLFSIGVLLSDEEKKLLKKKFKEEKNKGPETETIGLAKGTMPESIRALI